jgi:hypothetical protein
VNLKRSFNKESLKQMAANMNYKWIASLIVLIAGIVIFILSVQATKKIAEAVTLSQTFSDFFKHNPSWNPIIQFFGGTAEHKIEYYNNIILILQIGGVVLTALGAVMLVFFRKKNNKKEK